MRIDIMAQDSFSYPSNHCHPEMPQESVYMGHNKAIYLFFNLPSCFYTRDLLQAKLILFKLPSSSLDLTACDQYALYPLLEVFSVFNDLFSPPAIDPSRGITFENSNCHSYTEIDITKIAQDWISGKLENNGLLLTGGNDAPYAFYASRWYKIIGMRPVIRSIYRDCIRSCSLRSVPCDVEVTGLSRPENDFHTEPSGEPEENQREDQ